MSKAFATKGLDSPRFSAELLVAHVLKCERLKLYMEVDRPASPEELLALRDLTARALKHEPVQYLTGEAWFYGAAFKTDRRALIPRPATETLVETAVHHLRSDDAPKGPVLDLCTGSGCVAISLALVKQLAGRGIVATDLSPDALTLAIENAAAHQVSERIEFVQGNLFEALTKTEQRGPYAAVVSNPPYIPDHEWAQVEPNVRNHEPTLALRGGVDGLDLVRPIVQQAGSYLADGGLLAVEVAASTADVVRGLFEIAGLSEVQVLSDFERLPRVVMGVWRI